MEIQLTFDASKVTANIQRLQQQAPIAVARALNKSIASGRTIMARDMSQDLGLKVGVVRDAIKLKEATASRLTAQIAATMKRIPLIDFNATGPEPSRGQGRGVSYRIGGQRKRIPFGFIGTMQSGHRGVFARLQVSTRKSAGAWSKNLPIAELKGPSLGHVFIKFRPNGLARSVEQLRKNLVAEFRFVMSRAA